MPGSVTVHCRVSIVDDMHFLKTLCALFLRLAIEHRVEVSSARDAGPAWAL